MQVVATIGTVNKSASVEVIDHPGGDDEIAYGTGHAAQTAIALAYNLVGSNPLTLEPLMWASTNYPTMAQHNDIADAARHAYWSCLLARYCGADYAEGITTAHEVSHSGPSTETVMDLHNNAIGIAICSSHTHGSGNFCCQAAVVAAALAGQLWYLDGSYGPDDTAEGTLLQPTNR